MAALGAAAITAAGAAYSQHQNKKNQKQLMDYQNAANVQNWQRENSYNSPAAQMQRLKAAGLNPNLVYQSGAQNTSGSIESPQFGSSDVDYTGIAPAAFEAYQAVQRTDMQRDAIDSTIALNLTQQALNETLKGLQASNKEGQDIKNAVDVHKIPYAAQDAYNEAQANYWNAKNAEKTFDLLSEQVNQTKTQTNLLKSQKKLTDKQCDHIQAQMDKMVDERFCMMYQVMLDELNTDSNIALREKQIEQIDAFIAEAQQQRNINKWIEDRYYGLHQDLNSKNPLTRFSAKLVQALYNLHDILPMSGSINH